MGQAHLPTLWISCEVRIILKNSHLPRFFYPSKIIFLPFKKSWNIFLKLFLPLKIIFTPEKV
jgi:hypothetical protein